MFLSRTKRQLINCSTSPVSPFIALINKLYRARLLLQDAGRDPYWGANKDKKYDFQVAAGANFH